MNGSRWRRGLPIAGVCMVAGCTSTVTPPPAPSDPVAVFVLREAMHVGLVLPVAEQGVVQRYVEYGFGDWNWYALGNDAWYRVFPTVLWPTPGTLCRREFAAITPIALRQAVPWVELDQLLVGRDAAAALQRELEAAFVAGAAARVERPELRMAFVPAPQSYWFPRTCADVAADWLEGLGCDVGWAPVRKSLAVAPAPAR